MPRVYNKYRDKNIPSDAIYIGRPTKWGNPFYIGRDGDRDEVCRKHRQYINEQPELIKQIKAELKGKDLVCFCKPLLCHGDILLEIANE